jgi:hypothetical protein
MVIALPAAAAGLHGYSYISAVRVESWLAGDLLAAEVPVIDGELSGDRSLQVPEEITLSVPVEVDGRRWDPLAETDPLAPYGQQLRISIGLQAGRDFVWVPRSPMLITDAQRDGDTVTVTAASLLQLVAEARLVTPLQPAGGDTFKSLARRLVEPAIPVVFDGDLIDRAVPVASLQWDEDRIGALYELAAAWPADLRMHADGYLLFEPFATPDAVALDARGDTVRLVAGTTRDGAINAVVARGTDETTGEQYQGVAYDLDSSSPTRYGGPFNPLPVPLFYASPLLTSNAQCAAAAATILSRRRRASARSMTQDIPPWPPLELGDLILVEDSRGTETRVTIESLRLPLVAGGGPMTLGLAVPGE